MSEALVQGAPAALLAASLYGVAPLLQAYAARRQPPGEGVGFLLLLRLAVRPLWLAGLAAEAVSFVLEVYALSKAPVALVAPVMACDMIVFALLARRTLGERITGPGRAGIVSMALGVALLAVAFRDSTGMGVTASTDQMLLFGAFGLAFAAMGAAAANLADRGGQVARAALLFGLTAGVCYAIATLATRQLGLLLEEHRLHSLLTSPAPYVLVVFSVLALSLEQRGLQDRAAVVAFPVTSGVSAFLPVVIGLTLLGESTPGGAQMIAFVVSLTMVFAGVIGLGHDRAAAIQAEQDIAAAGGDHPPGDGDVRLPGADPVLGPGEDISGDPAVPGGAVAGGAVAGGGVGGGVGAPVEADRGGSR